jgi:cell division protein FtsI (penicillin-binding protein 3)
VLLERHLDPRIHKALFEEGHAGLGFERAHRRFYPQGRAAVHITGFTDIDGKGLSGAEAAFDALLNEGFHAPLEMSVDLRAQSHVHNELEAAMASNGARAAIAIVMDVETGEIISMVSLPDHDPHQPATAPAEARLNRALASRYELGSVYKALTFAAAIDHGVLDLNERLDLPEALRVGRHVIRDAHPVNAEDAASPVMQFAHSSNVASVSIALRLSSEEQGGFYQRLGLLEAAPVGYRESAAPLPPAPLSTSTRAAMSYGYSISVSPVAFLSAFNATVNGGFQVDPTFTKVDPRTGSHRTRVMSPRTSEEMRTLLRAAVEFGTATKAQVEGYAVGGKTGTALKIVNGAYNHEKVVSTFVAAFPMEQPRYSVLVLFDEPEGDGISRGRINAGFVAAPVAGRIIERIGPVLGVSPSMERRALTRLASNEAAP